eukprot:430423-Prymnesium_polylepis.1
MRRLQTALQVIQVDYLRVEAKSARRGGRRLYASESAVTTQGGLRLSLPGRRQSRQSERG